MKSKEEFKQLITNFFNYNITTDYYNNEEKEKLVEQFKEILFYDDSVVRQFLASLFKSGSELVKKFSLEYDSTQDVENKDDVPDIEEVPETTDDGSELEVAPDEPEQATNSEQPINVPVQKEAFDFDTFLANTANKFLK